MSRYPGEDVDRALRVAAVLDALLHSMRFGLHRTTGEGVHGRVRCTSMGVGVSCVLQEERARERERV